MSVKTVKVDDYEKSTSAYFDLIKKNKPLTKKEEKTYHINDFSYCKKLFYMLQ